MGELTRREQVIGGASLVVLIAIFLPWENVNFTNETVQFDGWSTGIVGWGGALLLAAAGEYLVVRRLKYGGWAPPFGDSRLTAAVALIGLVLVIIRWTSLPSSPSVDTSPAYGLWIALVAGIVETAAALDEARRPVEPKN